MIDFSFEIKSDCYDRSSFWNKFRFLWSIFLSKQIQIFMLDLTFEAKIGFLWMILFLKQIQILMIDPHFETNSDSDDRFSFWIKFGLLWSILHLNQIQILVIHSPFETNSNSYGGSFFKSNSDSNDVPSFWKIPNSYFRSSFWIKFTLLWSILHLNQI
jgi:hypothetical protein